MGSCFSNAAGGWQAVGGAQDQDRENQVLAAVQALPGVRSLSSQIELSLSASDLRDKDIFSKSDPMAILYKKRRDGSLEELGRTEVILNSLSPTWITKLKLSYNFEEVQVLLFEVYDVDTKFSNIPSKNIPIQHQQLLGQVEFTLSQIVTAQNQTLKRELRPKGDLTKESRLGRLGWLTIKAEETTFCRFLVDLVISCTNLDNKDVLTKSDPFLCISRLHEDGSFIPVYKTEVIKNNLNPTWKPIRITLQQLCSGDVHCPLKLGCFNFNSNGKHDLIGEMQTSLNELKTIVEHGDNARDLKKVSTGPSANKVRGKIHINQCVIFEEPTFMDYICKGFELSFMVAIDFTASNGNPYQRDSLHYIDPSGHPNPYQAAIISVGEVLEFYDADKRFTAWGFGGRPDPNQPVSHCFNISGNQYVAEVDGVQGILQAYTEAVRHVILAGPTIFGPVINTAASIATAAMSQGLDKYFVLLIITDGIITDLQESINAIVTASSFPLSILIVGVGGADFREMDCLDADKKRLASTEHNGKLAVRDIVQFVPMRNVEGYNSLAQMLLSELPSQFLEYMHLRRITS